MDGFPSGQRGQTVNLLQIASMVRIHLRPVTENPASFDAGFFAQMKQLKSWPSRGTGNRFQSRNGFFGHFRWFPLWGQSCNFSLFWKIYSVKILYSLL